MAYLNEFPNLKPNELNLNWLLEQYSTFNARIQEILNHFDETVAEIRQDLSTFENSINTQFDEFKTEVRNESYTVERTLETITNNMTEYVGEHMSEWQVNASRLTVSVSEGAGSATIPDVLTSEHDVVIFDYFWATRNPDTQDLIRNYGSLEDIQIILENDHYVVGIFAPFSGSATCYVHYAII